MTMKKQFLYVSTAAVLAMSFASCVDNDEPRGLRELRYAKANQWNALADQTRTQTKYKDSAYQILLNRAQELTNLYNEEHNTYTLAVEKAKADYDVAKYKYDLAVAYSDQITAEKAKEALAKAQKAYQEAQWALDKYNKEASVRTAQLEAQIKADLVEAQHNLELANLKQKNYTADLTRQTFSDNLLKIKEMSDTKISKLGEAFTLLESKETAMIVAQNNLETAEQNLLVAINGVEKDSLTRLNTLTDAVALAENNYKKQIKEVELAQKKYDDFVAETEKDEQDWSAVYNDLESEIKALRLDSAQYEIALARAKQTVDSAQKAYNKKKTRIDSVYNAANNQERYLSFEVDSAIAAEIEGKTYGPYKAEQGLIANATSVKSGDLKLDDLLNAIGDGDKKGNDGVADTYFNLTKSQIKELEGKIDGRKDQIKGKETAITGQKSEIAAKEANNEKLKQDSLELSKQSEIKKKYDDLVALFLGTKAGNYQDGAVAKYQAKALEYRWSDQRNKSTLYEEVVEAIDAFQKARTKALADADNATKKYQYSDEKYKVKTLRNAAQSQIKSYWTLRTAFDGTKPSKSVEDNVINNNYGATESDIDKFDNVVAAAAVNTTDLLCTAILKSNNRVNNGEEEGGVYGQFYKVANDLLGTTTKYRLYTEDELLAEKETKTYPYQYSMGMGTMGKYYGWLYDQEKLGKDIADNNKKIVEFKEKIVEYEEEIVKLNDNEVKSNEWSVKMANWGIAQFEAKIAVNDKWQALYDKIKKVKDDNQAEINSRTLDRQKSYETELQGFADELNTAKAEKQIISDALDLVKAEMGIDKNIQKTAKKLAGLTADEIKAIEITIKYQLLDLEYAIDAKEQIVEDKQIALLQAQKDLADFQAGEYDSTVAGKKDYFEEILAADKAVKEAQTKYNAAVKAYEVAQAYVDEVLAAVED
jgi:hypothetical protein